MPNPNAIISMEIQLDPPLERGVQALPDEGIAVSLEGERRVRLETD